MLRIGCLPSSVLLFPLDNLRDLRQGQTGFFGRQRGNLPGIGAVHVRLFFFKFTFAHQTAPERSDSGVGYSLQRLKRMRLTWGESKLYGFQGSYREEDGT